MIGLVMAMLAVGAVMLVTWMWLRPLPARSIGLVLCAVLVLWISLRTGFGWVTALLGGVSVALALLWRCIIVWQHLKQSGAAWSGMARWIEQWRTRRARHATASEQRGRHAAPHAMTTEEACAILGVPAHASKTEIIAAHHRLMLKNHPDQGGSVYLAQRINLARDYLIEALDP